MKKHFIAFLILSFNLTISYAQTEATTKDGKKVILNENKTWEYAKTEEKNTETKSEIKDCNTYISIETDKVTGKSTTASKKTLIISSDGGKTGFGIFMMKISETVVLSIQAAGSGSCIDEDAKMNILFRDGTRLEVTNNGKFNCERKFTLYLGGQIGGTKNLELLKAKEIETMRVWTSKSYVEKDFSSTESKQFMQTISCLSE